MVGKVRKRTYWQKPKPVTMKINGIPIRIGVETTRDKPAVYLHIGVQGFHMEYDTKTRAKWFAQMLRVAFRTIKNGK